MAHVPAAWLTYRIGVELFERRTALIAASLQAINPFVMTLVHGYLFSDNIDVALLFWVEVGVYCLVRAVRTGLWRYALLAGAAQGLAFLCKSYLAAIVFALALTAWLLPVCRLAGRDDCRMSAGRLLALKHLYGNVENWGAPWDRLLFDYLIAIQGHFYTPVLVAALALIAAAVVQRHSGLWLCYAWAVGVILPHLFAVTMTPSATLLALPACLLLLGRLVSEASRGARWPIAALAGILVMNLILPVVNAQPGRGFPQSQEFGAIMMESIWIIWHVTGALAIAAMLAAAWRWLPSPPMSRMLAGAARYFCVCAMLWLCSQTVLAAWRVTETDFNDPAAVELGEFAHAHVPALGTSFLPSRSRATMTWSAPPARVLLGTMKCQAHTLRNCAMLNPFTEIAHGDSTDVELAEGAKNGDRAALEQLVLRHQAWIYNIAVRMVFHPQDAEEVTQEVLIKVITKLSTFKGESKFRTWLYRIAANHVLNMKRRSAESRTTTFADYGAAIQRTPDLDLPDPKSVPVSLPILVEETKNSCTMGMLLCLDRTQRLIFTLGAILGVSDAVGGEVLELSADNFRQCLARARRDLHNFMNNQCGLVNKSNPCRCPKKTRGFIEAGHVDPHQLLFVPEHVERVRDVAADTVREIDDLVERQHTAIYREHPFLQPSDHIDWLRRLLELDEVRGALHLN